MNGKQVLVFKMTGCGPCERLLPFINNIGTHYMTKVPAHVKVNTTIIDTREQPGIAASYGVDATPTIVFLNNGSVVGRVEGGNTKQIEELYYQLASM